MEVPENQLDALTEEIENLPTRDGTITINNILYEYRNCDVTEANLGIAEPIPTLSGWGILAMAALLGIAGFIIVIRRRSTTH